MAGGETPKPRGSLIPVLVTVVSIMVLLVGLVIFTGRIGLLMIAAIAVVLALPVLHYVTWGWWLSSVIRESEPPEEEDEAKR